MDITQVYVTQRGLRRLEQVSLIVEAIRNGEYITPILLSENEDTTVQIDDGHHRIIAYWLAGRKQLNKNEYILVLTNRLRPRFGKVPDLLMRVTLL